MCRSLSRYVSFSLSMMKFLSLSPARSMIRDSVYLLLALWLGFLSPSLPLSMMNFLSLVSPPLSLWWYFCLSLPPSLYDEVSVSLSPFCSMRKFLCLYVYDEVSVSGPMAKAEEASTSSTAISKRMKDYIIAPTKDLRIDFQWIY